MKWTRGLLLGALTINLTVAGAYRVESKSSSRGGDFVTEYACYDRDVKCIRGHVVTRGDTHASTTFEIIYKGGAVAQIAMAPGYDAPKIVLFKNAHRRQGTYQGQPFVWLHVWDGIARRSPLPGGGHYIIDPDGHVRKPKPEERIAIWESQK